VPRDGRQDSGVFRHQTSSCSNPIQSLSSLGIRKRPVGTDSLPAVRAALPRAGFVEHLGAPLPAHSSPCFTEPDSTVGPLQRIPSTRTADDGLAFQIASSRSPEPLAGRS